jgi:hypothetical protein
MMRSLLALAALALCACAASPVADGGSDPELAFALGVDLSCNADEVRHCPAGGCPAGEGGSVTQIPISLSVPDGGGAGRFCMATGCEDARFEPRLTRALGWTAVMITDDRSSMRADLEIARDLRTFRLRQSEDDGVSTWTGECSPAGS